MEHFKDRFLFLINLYVPTRFLSSCTLPSWMPHSLKSKIRKCKNLFKQAQNSSTLLASYRSLCNEISSDLLSPLSMTLSLSLAVNSGLMSVLIVRIKI